VGALHVVSLHLPGLPPWLFKPGGPCMQLRSHRGLVSGLLGISSAGVLQRM
jgi:hypothetical protein